MKKIYTILLFFLVTMFGYTQTEISSFNATGGGYATTFLTDYQCLGINPANLGWKWNGNTMNLGFLEFSGNIYAQPLTRKQVYGDLFDESIQLNSAEQMTAANEYTDKRMWAQAGITWLGFSYQDEKIGGFAFSIRDRMQWNSKLNDQASQFLFLGYHAPYFDSLAVQENGDTIGYSTDPQFAIKVYQGTRMQAIWYREYNLGYGRVIMNKKDFTWYGGIGVKYITGYGSYQYYQDGDNLVAYSAFSPIFEVEYNEPTPSKIDGNGLKKVGNGFGIDIGFTFLIKEKLKIGVALNDIGFINWNGNVYQGNNVLVYQIETSGMTNYNIFSQGELIVADNKPGDPSMWTGLEKKKMNLPMHVRGGGSYRFNPKIEAGLDFYIPINKDVPGAYEKMVFGIGGHYDPAKWVQLSLSVVTGGQYGTNIPFGVSFFPQRNEKSTWQLGFGVRDMITFFKSKNPNASAAFGFLRFSFGTKKEKLEPGPVASE